MRHFFHYQLRILCLCIILLCCIFVDNTITAEKIIYQPNRWHQKGIWISNADGHNARRLFNPSLNVTKISIQEGDRYILCVGEGVGIESGYDAYLFDTKNPNKDLKDLTYGHYSNVKDAAISPNGDVIFSNMINNRFPDGIYHIPNHEIHKTFPMAEKLYSGPANYVDWAPNGKEAVFSNKEGIFLLDISTKQISQLLDHGYRPVFSPDGSKLVFIVLTPARNNRKPIREIGMISLDAPGKIKMFDNTRTELYCNYLTWTPDGKSISYVFAEVELFLIWIARFEYTNFVLSITNGRSKQIFQNIEGGVPALEWTQKSYPVEPESKLATTWGQLKRDAKNGGYHE